MHNHTEIKAAFTECKKGGHVSHCENSDISRTVAIRQITRTLRNSKNRLVEKEGRFNITFSNGNNGSIHEDRNLTLIQAEKTCKKFLDPNKKPARVRFWKLLNKTEKKHLHGMGVHNIAAFERTRESQIKTEKEHEIFCCFECSQIAAKVGMK